MLVKLLKNMLEPRAAKIETTQDLRTKCLNQPVCGLLLKGSKTVNSSVKNAVSNLLEQHPKVSFASVDASVLFVRNLEEYLPEYQPGVHRFVVFEKVSGGTGSKDDRLVTSIATLDDKAKIGYASMNNLVQSVVDKKASMQKIPALPVIKTRTKKLEQEERAKRQRKEQRDSSTGSSSSTPGGQFTPNDGSKEGRKAERERRRAEHYAQQNVKPKTPEEIAEMERKRRIRMQEEAERWNMGNHEEGGGDGSGGYDIGEETEEYVVEEGDEVEEDEEDVIDLD